MKLQACMSDPVLDSKEAAKTPLGESAGTAVFHTDDVECMTGLPASTLPPKDLTPVSVESSPSVIIDQPEESGTSMISKVNGETEI